MLNFAFSFLLLLLVQGAAVCQGYFPSPSEIVGGLSQYRQEVLSTDTEGMARVGLMLEKMKAQGFSEEEIDRVTFNIHYLFKVHEREIDSISGNIIDTKRVIPAKDVRIISENAELIELINAGVLEIGFPFRLKIDTSLLHEYRFIGIKHGDRVAEIGAGSGVMSKMIAAIYRDLELYINELSEEFVKYLFESYQTFESRDPSNHVEIVQGSKKSTELEREDLNVIYMKSTYHHFRKKKKMLKSISKSLSDDGYMVIIEPNLSTYSEDELKHACNKIVPTEEIIEEAESSGFKLIDRMESGYLSFLKFQVER